MQKLVILIKIQPINTTLINQQDKRVTLRFILLDDNFQARQITLKLVPPYILLS